MFESEDPPPGRGLSSGSANTPSIGAWFEQDQTPRLIVQRDFAIMAANRAARALLSSGRCLVERGGKLACVDRVGHEELCCFVDGLGREPRLRVLCAGRRNATIVRAQQLQDSATFALTVRSVAEHPIIECPDLEPLFGVTPAEHRVILLLLQGHTPAGIAKILQKSVLTVRTHLKRIYPKLGVSTREQLFARLSAYLFMN